MQDIQRQTHTMQVSAGDRIDMLFSLGFSASLACIYTALLNGASLWLNDLKQSGIRGLFNWLQSNKITISTLGPRTLRTMLDTVDKSDVLSGLRFLCSGGDTLLRKDIVSLRRHASPFCVIQNAYATTETRTITELLIHGRSPLPDENILASGTSKEGFISSAGKTISSKSGATAFTPAKLKRPSRSILR